MWYSLERCGKVGMTHKREGIANWSYLKYPRQRPQSDMIPLASTPVCASALQEHKHYFIILPVWIRLRNAATLKKFSKADVARKPECRFIYLQWEINL